MRGIPTTLSTFIASKDMFHNYFILPRYVKNYYFVHFYKKKLENLRAFLVNCDFPNVHATMWTKWALSEMLKNFLLGFVSSFTGGDCVVFWTLAISYIQNTASFVFFF